MKRVSQPFNVNLGAWFLFMMLVPPFLYFAALFIYLLEGRYSRFLPTISETGTLTPNRDILLRFFTSITITTGFSQYILSWYTLEKYRPTNLNRKIWFFLIHYNIPAMMLVAYFPMDIHNSLHHFFAFTGFFTVAIVQIYIYVAGRKHMTKFQRYRRFIYILLQFISLFVICTSDPLFPYRASITISTLGEYSELFFLQCFFLSYFHEVNQYDVNVVILE